MVDRVRVAHVIDSLGLGGAEQALLNLVPGFKRANACIVVIPLFEDRRLQKAYIDEGIEVVHVEFGYKWNFVKNISLLASVLRERNIQVVHAHLIFSGIYVGLIKLLKLPIVRIISFHNLAYAKGCNPVNLSFFLRKALNWFVLRFCYDQILAVSSAVGQHYCQHFGLSENRISVVANGLPVAEYEKYCVQVIDSKGPSAPKRIVALGRLVKEKGYEYLLPAFAQLQNSMSIDIELYIVGGGPLENALKEQTEQLGLLESVVFTGSINHLQAMEKLSYADLYVLPSIFEGFGLAVAEAVLLEKVVVATRVGGVLDIVNDETAILVEPASPAALTEGLKQALNLSEDEKQKRIEQAKRDVIEHYSVEKIAGKLSGIYNSKLNSKVSKEQHG